MSDELGFEPVMGLFLDERGKGRVAISKEGWSFLPQEARLQLLEDWIAELGTYAPSLWPTPYSIWPALTRESKSLPKPVNILATFWPAKKQSTDL